MNSILRTALLVLFIMTFLLGLAYPLAVTGLAKVFFPAKAAGTLVFAQEGAQDGTEGGDGSPGAGGSRTVVGSSLIGQAFSSPAYFHGRPSATDYAGTGAGPSNLGPTSRKLIEEMALRATAVREANALPSGAAVPGDLVTASGSGVDPDITPEAALLQVARVAAARGLPEETILGLVNEHIDRPPFGQYGEGLLGMPRVNVLLLNLDLDALSLASDLAPAAGQ